MTMQRTSADFWQEADSLPASQQAEFADWLEDKGISVDAPAQALDRAMREWRQSKEAYAAGRSSLPASEPEPASEPVRLPKPAKSAASMQYTLENDFATNRQTEYVMEGGDGESPPLVEVEEDEEDGKPLPGQYGMAEMGVEDVPPEPVASPVESVSQPEMPASRPPEPASEPTVEIEATDDPDIELEVEPIAQPVSQPSGEPANQPAADVNATPEPEESPEVVDVTPEPDDEPASRFSEVSIGELEVDPRKFQARFEGDQLARDEYVRNIADDWQPGKVDPIRVARDSQTGKLVVIDGHHRYSAALQVSEAGDPLDAQGGDLLPVQILEGDVSNPDDLAELQTASITTNLSRQEVPLHTQIDQYGRLRELNPDWESDDLQREMNLSAREADELDALSYATPAMKRTLQVSPAYKPYAVELAKRVRTGRFNPEFADQVWNTELMNPDKSYNQATWQSELRGISNEMERSGAESGSLVEGELGGELATSPEWAAYRQRADYAGELGDELKGIGSYQNQIEGSAAFRADVREQLGRHLSDDRIDQMAADYSQRLKDHRLAVQEGRETAEDRPTNPFQRDDSEENLLQTIDDTKTHVTERLAQNRDMRTFAEGQIEQLRRTGAPEERIDAWRKVVSDSNDGVLSNTRRMTELAAMQQEAHKAAVDLDQGKLDADGARVERADMVNADVRRRLTESKRVELAETDRHLANAQSVVNTLERQKGDLQAAWEAAEPGSLGRERLEDDIKTNSRELSDAKTAVNKLQTARDNVAAQLGRAGGSPSAPAPAPAEARPAEAPEPSTEQPEDVPRGNVRDRLAGALRRGRDAYAARREADMPRREADQWAKDKRRELLRLRKGQGYDGLQPKDLEYIARGRAQIAGGGETPGFDIPNVGQAPGTSAQDRQDASYERRLRARAETADYRAEQEHKRALERERKRADARADRSAVAAWGGPAPDMTFGDDPSMKDTGQAGQAGDWHRNRDRFGRFAPGGTSPAPRKRPPSRAGQPRPSAAAPEDTYAITDDGMSPGADENVFNDDGIATQPSPSRREGRQPASEHSARAAQAGAGSGNQTQNVDVDVVVSGADEGNKHFKRREHIDEDGEKAATVVDDKGRTRAIGIDADGDGKVDSYAVDTNGDGKPDKILITDGRGRAEALADLKLRGARMSSNGSASHSIDDEVEADLKALGGGLSLSSKGTVSAKGKRSGSNGRATMARPAARKATRRRGKMFKAMTR